MEAFDRTAQSYEGYRYCTMQPPKSLMLVQVVLNHRSLSCNKEGALFADENAAMNSLRIPLPLVGMIRAARVKVTDPIGRLCLLSWRFWV